MKYIFTVLTIFIITEYFLEKISSTELNVTNNTYLNHSFEEETIVDYPVYDWNTFIHTSVESLYSSFTTTTSTKLKIIENNTTNKNFQTEEDDSEDEGEAFTPADPSENSL